MARARLTRGRPLHGLLLVDKPAGASSNHVLQQVRRSLDARKAGHAGTLDPLATGMLPVLLGEATKLAGYLLDADKAYETTLRLGIETDSLDADGRVMRKRPVPAGLNRESIAAVVRDFVGAQLQTPPMVSAIKVDGQRLYKLAREGIEVERKARAITIHAIEILALSDTTVRLAVRCSKGTYIRVLGADIGERLGCGAHVEALRRTWVAPFEGAALHSPDVIERDGDVLLLPLDAGLAHLPMLQVDEAGLRALRHGQPAQVVAVSDAAGSVPVPGDAIWRVYGPQRGLCHVPDSRAAGVPPGSGLVALGTRVRGELDDIVRPVRVLQLAPDA